MEEKTLKIIEQAPVGIVTFSAEGEIDYLNENFKKFDILYHFESPSLLGSNILQVDIFQNIDIKKELEELLGGYPFEKEIKQVSAGDGHKIELIVKGTPLYEEQKVIGGMLLIEDIKVLNETKNSLGIRSEFIEKAIHNVNDVLIITNPQGVIQFAEGPGLEDLNLAKKEIVGINILSLFIDKTESLLSTNMDKVISSEKSVKFEFDNEHEKIKHSFNCKIEPVLSKRGAIQFLFFFINNITLDVSQRNKLTKTVNELTFYKSITKNLNNALFTLDRDGKIIYWDDQSEKLFGFTKQEVTGKFFGSTLELFDKRFFENIKKDLETEKIWKLNLNIFGNEQRTEIFEAKFSFLDDNHDTIVVMCSNITKKVKEEEKLKLEINDYQNILSGTNDMICKLDGKGLISYTNKTLLGFFGYEKEELNQAPFMHLIHNSYFESSIFELKSFDKVNPTSLDLPLITNSGLKFSAKVIFVPFRNKGNGEGFVCYISQLPVEEKPDEAETLYGLLFNASQDGIAVESEGKIVIANDSFANIFGFESGQSLIEKDLLDLVSNDDILKVAEYFRLKEQDKNAPDRFEFLGRKKDNALFYTELSLSSFKTNSKKYIVMVTRDITERKRAQKAIRESEEKYRNITENIDDFLYTFEKSGELLRPLFYTAAVEKITGYTQADFLGDSKLFLKLIHKDDFPDVKQKLADLLKSKSQTTSEMQFRIHTKQRNIAWVRNKITLQKDASGEIKKVYGLVSDITLYKRAEEELRISTEDLMKLNETKDRFISIISHDLRTPFSSILGFTDLLANDEGLTNEERKQYVKYIQESSKSMLSLVNSLLDWTRLQTGRIKFEPERVEASPLIEKSINTVSGEAMRKGVEIYSTIARGKNIFADQGLITQVFNNLLSNAIKFSSNGDRITISSKPVPASKLIEFSIRDTGAGIKEENISKLFNVDTKFTTEGTAGERGSGLGLSLVKEIIEKHGGTIRAESVFGKGSNFRFTVPIASATILIVDNNKTERVLYSKILKNITPDYTIDTASNGKEAFDKIKAAPPALIVSEHFMPEMDGYNLVKQLKKEGLLGRPPVIILTTELDRSIDQDYKDLGVELVFQKPVNLRSLKEAVEKSLKESMTTSDRTTSPGTHTS